MRYVTVVVFLSACCLCAGAADHDQGEYGEKLFPVGVYGELSFDINKNYSLFWEHKNLLLSYRHKSCHYNIVDRSGAKPTFDTAEEVNSHCAAALIKSDFAAFAKIFKPADYDMPELTEKWPIQSILDSFAKYCPGCVDAVVVGEVSSTKYRHFIMRSVGTKDALVFVLGYQEYAPGKWRYDRCVQSNEYERVFVSTLLAPAPVELDSANRKNDDYMEIPLSGVDYAIPANEILIYAVRADSMPVGKVLVTSLEGLLSSIDSIPEDPNAPIAEAWRRVASFVTPSALENMKEDNYDKLIAQGVTPAVLKDMLVNAISGWQGRRYVVDCGKIAYLICLDKETDRLGCVPFLKEGESKYRICDIAGSIAGPYDFPGLFLEEEFRSTLRKKLLELPY